MVLGLGELRASGLKQCFIVTPTYMSICPGGFDPMSDVHARATGPTTKANVLPDTND